MKVALAHTSEVTESAPKEVEFFGRSLVLVKSGEVYSAFANYCAHASGPLALEGGQLRCQWHGASFDPLNGRQLAGPRGGCGHLIRIPTRLEDGQIFYVYGE